MRSKLQLKQKLCVAAIILAVVEISGMNAVVANALSPAIDNEQLSKYVITLSPTRAKLDLAPAQTSREAFTVTNNGASVFGVRIYVVPYQVDENQENVFDKNTKFTYLSKWIKFDDVDDMGETAFWLEPGGFKEVGYSVNVPFNAPSGGQYAAIMTELLRPDDITGTLTQTNRIAIHVYGEVAGDIQRQGEILERKIEFWHNSREVATAFEVKNTGNVDFDVSGKLIVRDLFGSFISETEAKSAMMLPETKQKIELVFQSPILAGVFSITQRVSINGQEYDEVKTVLVLPVWVIMLAMISLALLILLFRRWRERQRVRRTRNHAKTNVSKKKPAEAKK